MPTESYKYDTYYPIILSLSDNQGNINKVSLSNGYVGGYTVSVTSTPLRVGNVIQMNIIAVEPQARQIYYRWESNSLNFNDLVGLRWSTSNVMTYQITPDDLKTTLGIIRIVGEIKTEKEYFRWPADEMNYDDAAFLEYRLLK